MTMQKKLQSEQSLGRALFSRRLGRFTTSNLALAALASGAALAPMAQAQAQGLPTGGTVAAGTASVDTAKTSVTVTQSSDRAVLNWDSFSVANGNIVQFNQPNAQSATLNRVNGDTSSVIAGKISANGTIYLVNPNGIAITSTGTVQTGGSFVASSLDTSDADFMAGRGRFKGKGASRSVENAGSIKAGSGAYVALLGGAVSNSGSVVVPLGKFAMGSGEQIALDLNGGNFLQVAVPTELVTGKRALIDNSGTITVAGGAVELKAAVLKDAVRNVINMSGSINVDSAIGDGGTIYLIGGSDTQNMAGQVKVSGSLSARATGAEGNGGFIETSGTKVDLQTASVSTSAAQGRAGLWLIDPVDFTVAASGGEITGAQLSANLANGNIRILSSQGASGTNGDININDAVSWSRNTLTLDAFRDINVNAVMRATGTAGFVGVVGDTALNGTGSSSGNLDFGLNSGGFYGRLDLAPTTSFNLNGISYTIITSLGAAGSETGTDLQGINGVRTLTRLTGNFVLGSDIDASDTASWNGGQGFLPIGAVAGTSPLPFDGNFNGLGHVVSNLTQNYTNRGSLGLFGQIGTSGSVTNVGMRGGSITGVIGFTRFGALAGTNSGIIRNAFASTKVTGDFTVGGLVGNNERDGTIFNAFATGDVFVIRSGGGGLAGASTGRISNAFATGAVTGLRDGTNEIGGLVGNLGSSFGRSGIVENSFASGNVSGTRSVGGLVGYAGGSVENPVLITDAYATGTVTTTSPFFQGGGGGLLGTGLNTTITRVYATGRVFGASSLINGLVGYADHNSRVSAVASYWDAQSTGQSIACGNSVCLGSTTPLTSAEMRLGSSFVGWNVDRVGGSGSTWRIYEGRTTPLLVPLLTPVIVGMASNSVNLVYTGQSQTNAAGATTRLAVNGDAADQSRIFGTITNTCSGGASSCVNVGNYTITANVDLFSDQLGYDLIVQNPLAASLTITPAPVSVTYAANTATGVYGNAPGALTGSVSATGLLNGDTLGGTVQGSAIWTTAASSTSGVGTYAITGSGLRGINSNYAFTFVQAASNLAAYTVTPRPINVTANAASSVYGAALPTFTFTIDGVGLVNGDSLNGALASSATSTSNVGNYVIGLGSLGNANYAINFTGANHSITPAALTITGRTQNAVYTSLAQTNGFTTSGLVGSDQVTNVAGLASATNVGTYSDNLSAATGTGLSNYVISYVNGGLTITPASLTVTGNSGSRVYSGLNQTNGFTVAGLLGNDTVTGVSGLASGTNAGSYSDLLSNATGVGLANYAITYVNRGLSITPASLIVTYSANAANGIYGNAPANLSGGLSSVGLVGGDSLATVLQGSANWNASATSTSNVGTYAITGSGLVGNNANYAVTFVQAAGNARAYTVAARPISVTANAATFVYGAALPALTFAVGGSGLVNGDTLSGALATIATSRSNVGNYAITLGTLANTNYVISYTGANVSITPAALRIVGNTTSLDFNGTLQTNGFTTTGLIGDDKVSGVSGLATGTAVGTYADALSAATGSGLTNYTITYVNGALTIKALPGDAALVPFLPFADESGNGPQTEAERRQLGENPSCPPGQVSSTLREQGQASLACAL